jgi:crotonobetainyl-CoA:carnitine CoA-transferase CaiB-like acyl-CoA transferase
MTEPMALSGILIVELGHRIAAGLAGSVLAQAGADVVIVEPGESSSQPQKWDQRALAAAGKLSVGGVSGLADKDFLRELVASADIVIISDLDPDWHKELLTPQANQIVCDISAFGSTGPLAGETDSDLLIQATAGVMDVTGMSSQPPAAVGLPVSEVSAGLYAASAIAAALRFRDMGGGGQHIEVSLYDCAVNAQATFLPSYFSGKTPKRAGNRHAMCAPWNCYQAKDRWVLVCSATNDQWLRLCEVMQRSDLAADPSLKTLADRLAKCDEVDAAVQDWVGKRTFAECIDALGNAGLACGPIVPVDALHDEANLALREFIRTLINIDGKLVSLPASPFHATPALGQTATRIPKAGEDIDVIKDMLRARGALKINKIATGIAPAPLAGIRVLEIGQYTTAPLAARHLATLGAKVFKIEPPQGESSRYWPPHKNGQGYFFTLSNSDKESVMIDLGTPSGCEEFKALLRKADVFVENTKPGSLARRGFGPADLEKINPRLIYCAISGFGYRSAYPQRPAFDTVIQAMSGVMDLTRSGGVPVKAGISIADIIGGQFALLGILLALKQREATGRGAFIDLAMQEACAWSTQFGWSKDARSSAHHLVIQCQDAFIVAEASQDEVTKAIGSDAAHLPADKATNRLRAAGLPARRVLNVAEVAEAQQVEARKLILWRSDRDGTEWPLLGSPMQLSTTPSRVETAIGTLGSGNGIAAALIANTTSLTNKKKEKVYV